MLCNSIFPTGPIPAPASEIAARFCTENVNSPEYEKIKELEQFNNFDQLLIRRSVDAKDRETGNAPNTYEITNRTGHPVFKVVQTLEPSTDLTRPTSAKPFKLTIFDLKSGNEVLKVVAKQGADSVVVFSRQKHNEYHGIGKILRIRRGSAIKAPSYNVRGSSGKVVFKVNGSLCLLYKKACLDIATADGAQNFGKIMKDPEDQSDSGKRRRPEMAIDDIIYRIKFPIDISMVSKALILATTLVLDYDYFECGVREEKADFMLMTAALAFVTFVVLLIVVVITVSVTKKLALLGKSGGLPGIESSNSTSGIVPITSAHNDLDRQFEILRDKGNEDRQGGESLLKDYYEGN